MKSEKVKKNKSKVQPRGSHLKMLLKYIIKILKVLSQSHSSAINFCNQSPQNINYFIYFKIISRLPLVVTPIIITTAVTAVSCELWRQRWIHASNQCLLLGHLHMYQQLITNTHFLYFLNGKHRLIVRFISEQIKY